MVGVDEAFGANQYPSVDTSHQKAKAALKHSARARGGYEHTDQGEDDMRKRLVALMMLVCGTTTAWADAKQDCGNKSGDVAIAACTEAIRSNPNSPSYLNTLAAAYAEKGRFSEAIDAGDRALTNSHLRGEPANVQQIFAQRLEILKAHKPLRN